LNSKTKTNLVAGILVAVALSLLLPANVNAQRTTRGRTARPARTTTGASTTPPRTPTPRAQPTVTSDATGVNLSAKDIEFILDGLSVPPESRAQLAQSQEERQFFVDDLKQMFAVAEEARASGFTQQPDIKLQLELQRAFVVAREYNRKRQVAGATKPEDVVSKAEIAAFVKEPGQDKKFAEFLQDYMRNARKPQDPPLTDAQREELRQNWANVMVNSRKGTAAGVDQERPTQVIIMYQQARLLAAAYFQQKLSAQAKATEPELDAYLAQHPELNPKEARAKAEAVLQRVRAGEDFATLARQFSTDPGSKDSGGDLGWFGRGMMVKPFEEAAFALKPGEVSGIVESQFGFHIIKLEERRTQNGTDGKPAEQVHARHILIPAGGQPGRNGPPQTPREQARAAVERQKRDVLFNDILSRSRIRIASDFRADASQQEVNTIELGGRDYDAPKSPAPATPQTSPAPQVKRQTPPRPAPAKPRRTRP
jgi:hypothetical protein